MRLSFSKAQQLIWTGQELHPGVPLYNMARGFFIDGALDPEVFRLAWQSVVDRSDALRTVVERHLDRVQPLVQQRIDGALLFVDLSAHADPEGAAEEWANGACRQPLDPTHRLFDTSLIRLANDRWIWYLNQHHLITDAWSAGQVYRRMSEAYADAETSRPTSAEPWPEFAAYVEHEASVRETPQFAEAESHWRDRFEGAPVSAPFYGRTAATTRSVRVTRELGPATSRRIRELATSPDRSALTPQLSYFTFFAGVLAAYMARVTSNTRPTFGVVSHNRPTASFQQTIGPFFQVFPMRIETMEGDTFRSLAAKVKQAATEFLHHARPGASRPEYQRQCNATLNYLDASLPDFAGRTARSESIHAGHVDTHHVLRIHVLDHAETGEFVLQFDCNEDVFDAGQRSEAIGHFMRLMEAFLSEPERPINDVDLLSDSEREQLLVDWNASSVPPSGGTILARFEHQSALHPEREAVRTAGTGTGLSYAELDGHATALARRLRRLGAGPDGPVAILIPPSSGSVVAMIAALKASAPFVPIDHKNPPGRVQQMLRASESVAVIVEGAPELDLPFPVPLVDWREQDELGSDGIDPAPGQGAQTAYIYFTSGSTGAPKGVRCGHTALLNLLDAFEAMGPVPDGAQATWWTSIGFDVSAYEIFGALLYGHTLHAIPEEMRADTVAFVDYLEEASIQSAYVPPFMLQHLAEAVEARQAAFDLRRVLVGVEPIPERVLRRIRRRQHRLALINGYGPTEATTCATLYPVGTGPVAERTAPIGRPVRNNQVYLLNDAGRPQPAGVAGELCIGGVGLALGYLDPAQEVGRFVPNPFGAGPLYRTGDLARLLPDGDLAFLGRIDHQLKVGGFRIEPGDVEFALNRQPEIAASAVTALDPGSLDDTSVSKRLVAYLTLQDSTTIDPAELRQRLRAELPSYMVPAAFVIVDRFPRTPNGKLDRTALPEPEPHEILRSDETPFVEPRTATERTLAAIWAEALGTERVGLHDNFFDLGGDSITAIQIVTRARTAGLSVTATQLFETLTVAAMAHVTGALGSEDSSGTGFQLPDLDETDLARLTELLQ